MKIERKEILDNIIRITTSDERWYYNAKLDKYAPSVTWVISYMVNKGLGQWQKEHTEEEINKILSDTSTRGTKIHSALEMLGLGEEVKHDTLFVNENGLSEELKADEYKAVWDFSLWCKRHKVEILHTEMTVGNKEWTLAGTLDAIMRVDDKLYLVDYKTSPSASYHDTWDMQMAALRSQYVEAHPEHKDIECLLLQIGYPHNKFGIKENYRTKEQIEHGMRGFKLAYDTWEYKCLEKEPKQRDYPLSIKL